MLYCLGTEYGGLTGQIEKSLDSIINKIPFASFGGAEYINQWGETEADDGEALDILFRILENFILPGYLSDVEANAAEDLIAKVYKETGETSVFPQYAKKTIVVDQKPAYYIDGS